MIYILGNAAELTELATAFSVTFSRELTEDKYAEVIAAYKAGWQQEYGSMLTILFKPILSIILVHYMWTSNIV